MQNPSKITTVAALAVLATTALTACGGDDSTAGPASGPVAVVAAFYPLQFVAERVGGDAVAVTNLVEPGAEPHDMELTPSQVRQIADAGLVVYLKGFQPAVDESVEQQAKDTSLDVAAVEPLRAAPSGEAHEEEEEAGGEEHAEESSGLDPHLWLDPTRLATIADRTAQRLATVDASRAADYQQRAAALRTDLQALDAEFTAGLKTCQRREIVTSHAAFGYLAARYNLEQIPISGLSPEAEPSPQRLAEVAAEAREHQVTTIFFETLVSPKVAETLAREVGAKAEVLDPIEGLQPGSTGDYFSVMRENLGHLRTALGCA